MVDAREYLQAVLDEMDEGGAVDIVLLVVSRDDEDQIEVEFLSTLGHDDTGSIMREMADAARPLHS